MEQTIQTLQVVKEKTGYRVIFFLRMFFEKTTTQTALSAAKQYCKKKGIKRLLVLASDLSPIKEHIIK